MSATAAVLDDPLATAAAPAAAPATRPVTRPAVTVGERCSRSVRYSREDITAFARLSGNYNPLHHDLQSARRARHGKIIASGEQTTAQMIGLASSYFSNPDHGQAAVRGAAPAVVGRGTLLVKTGQR